MENNLQKLGINPILCSDYQYELLLNFYQIKELQKGIASINSKRQSAMNSYNSKTGNNGAASQLELNPIYLDNGICKVIVDQNKLGELNMALHYLEEQRAASRKYVKKKKEISKQSMNNENICQMQENTPIIKSPTITLKIINPIK